MAYRRLTIASAIALAVATTGSVHAADPNSIEEFVVTATKREEMLKDVAMGISAVSGADLVRRNETGVLGWAAQVPGLSLEVSNPSQIRLVLRGANFGSVGATVATVIDDIPFSMTGAQSNGAVFGANVDTYDLQRVEVLRGPQGTLYGATAEGGLVKYVTNKPNLERFEGDVGLGGDTVKGGDDAFRVRGMINVPIIEGKLGLRVSAVRDDSPGWIDNKTLGADDWNDIEKYSVRASLLWQPTERFSARATYFDQNQVANGRSDIQVVGSALDPAAPPSNKLDDVDGMSYNSRTREKFENDMQVYGLNLQYDFDTFSVMSSTSYGELDIPRYDDLSHFPIAPGVSVSDAFGGIYQQPISVVIDQLDYLKKRSQELRVSSKPGLKLGSLALDWQAGVFYTKEKTILNQRINAFSLSGQVLDVPPLGAGVIPAELEETSGFADVTLHFTEQFDIALGARRSKTDQWNQTENYCCIIYGPADKVNDKLESDEKKTTYSFAPRYKFDDGTVLYARYATGYRAGGPNLPVPVVLENPPPLLPDSTKNYEIGLRTDLLDNRVSIDVTVFQIDWKDAQVLSIVDTPAGPFGLNGNAGTATSKGLEWNLGFRPTDDLLITLVGAYTDAKVTKDAPGLGALDGDELPFVSDVQATLNVDWTVGRFAGFDTVLGATYSYTGERYTNFGTAATTESHVKLPDYETLKLQLGIDNGKFNAQLYVNNLTNEDALLGYTSAGAANLTGFGPVLQPRTVGVFAGYKF